MKLLSKFCRFIYRDLIMFIISQLREHLSLVYTTIRSLYKRASLIDIDSLERYATRA